MNWNDTQIKKIIQNCMQSNLVNISEEDVTVMKKIGNDISLEPKHELAKGAVIFIQITQDTNLEEVGNVGEEFWKHAREDANVIYACHKANTQTTEHSIVYIY
jgi:cell division GTPase FtsZ